RTGQNARHYFDELLASLAEYYRLSLDTPVQELPPEFVGVVLYGSNGDVIPLRYRIRGRLHAHDNPFEGVIPYLKRRLSEAQDDPSREQVLQYMQPRICPSCHGARLRPELLAVTIA